MKWRPWRRPPPPEDAPTADVPTAEGALWHARRHKAEAEALWPTVRWLAAELQAHGQENHFGELLMDAMRRRDES